MSNQNDLKQSRATQIFSFVGFAILVGILFLYVGLPTYRQANADATVRKLCAKDGGIKVYEKVNTVSNNPAAIRILSKERAAPDDEYFYEHDRQYLEKGDPEVWRTQHRILRRSDGKLLGESISYSRRGGDIPGPWHPSSFTCPESKPQSGIEQAIFGNK